MAKIFGGSASRLEVYALFVAAVVLIGGGIGGAIVVASSDSRPAEVAEVSSETTIVNTTSSTAAASATTTSLPQPSTQSWAPPKFAGSDFQGLANWGNSLGVGEIDNPFYQLPLTEQKIIAWIDYRASVNSTKGTALTPANCRSADSMLEFNGNQLRDAWNLIEARRRRTGAAWNQSDKQYAVSFSLGRIYFICGEDMAREVGRLRPNCPGLEVLGKFYPSYENCDESEIQEDLQRWTESELETAISNFLPYRTRQ